MIRFYVVRFDIDFDPDGFHFKLSGMTKMKLVDLKFTLVICMTGSDQSSARQNVTNAEVL